MRLNPFRKKAKRGTSEGGWLRSETKRAIAGIVLLVFSVIAILSFFDAAGPTGQAIFIGLRRLVGYLAYLVPIALLALGIHLVRPQREGLPRIQMIGIALVVVGVLGIFHTIGIQLEDAYQVALDGKGGGLLGFILAFPLSKALSAVASGIIFVAAIIVGLSLSFNVSPAEILDWFKTFMPYQKTEDTEGSEEDEDQPEEDASSLSMPTFHVRRRLGGAEPDPNQLKLEQQRAQEEEQRNRVRQQVRSANKRYHLPSIDILHASVGRPNSGDVNANKEIIQSTLEKFGIVVTMGKVNTGPTVTQFMLRPEEGVKLSRITALQNDLALALAAHPIRIEAPIPGTNFVGIEIPNKDVSLVRLRDIITSKAFRRSESPLTIALGKDVAGKPRAASLESMPHLLIAGATGSGKSIFINALILSLLYRSSPALLKFIMVDPKRVELTLYNGIPHLLTPVIVEPDKTINALKWAVREMDRRYKLLSEVGARNLMSFNANNPDEALPMIVIVIDELAHLMSSHGRDVEGIIVRLAQMARAIGIHLVLATQRPSVNVITGLIKANVPARVAFNVASQVDSRTILDAGGAEKLLGSGDMLYLPGEQSKPIRLQGCFVSEEEVRQVVSDINKKNPSDADYDDTIVTPTSSGTSMGGEQIDDELFAAAKQVVIESHKASASLLQRRLRVGYARAARLLDMLEEQGVIGQQEGNKPRDILTQQEEKEEGQEPLHEEEEDEQW